jgi:ubiquitin carboxyl-terminal hydrolase 9/24
MFLFQDAVEFFMSLIDIVDEALKALNYEQTMAKILGGLFSDQKICKTCPHRYSREEPFSVISVDVKNHSNLVPILPKVTNIGLQKIVTHTYL